MRLTDTLNHFLYEYSLNELRQMNSNTLYPHISYNSLLYMDLIHYNRDCTVSQLAGLLHISKSAVTIKVNELIRQGLVTKTRSESDRRVYHLALAPQVEADYKLYNMRLKGAVELLSQRYTPTELETFCGMLDLIRDSVLQEPG